MSDKTGNARASSQSAAGRAFMTGATKVLDKPTAASALGRAVSFAPGSQMSQEAAGAAAAAAGAGNDSNTASPSPGGGAASGEGSKGKGAADAGGWSRPSSVAVRSSRHVNAARKAEKAEKEQQLREDEKAQFARDASGNVTQLDIAAMTMLYDPPVEGCVLHPYVSVRDKYGKTTALRGNAADKVTKLVEFRWSRGEKRICAAPKCDQSASQQCLSCVKAQVPPHMSYFCSSACWTAAWPQHRLIHKVSGGHKGAIPFNQDDAQSFLGQDAIDPAAANARYPLAVLTKFTEVAQSRGYSPATEDVGCSLRLECATIVGSGGKLFNTVADTIVPEGGFKPGSKMLGKWHRLETLPTLPVPAPPPPRNLVYKPRDMQNGTGSTFKTMCYNVLADIYATRHIYPYCEVWALSWAFRRNQILREILSHKADIVCLQEVQANHFDKWFHPHLSKAGYDGIFKKKTREAVGDNARAIDGCAIFYLRDRFALMEQYGIDFNEAARQQFSDRRALRRLMKGNIALVVVLEELTDNSSNSTSSPPTRRGRKRRLCVANTHIYWDPEFADVKLWQTWVLTQELEKLVLHRNLPLVLCGDFNSMPDSSVYELLSSERVHAKHRVFQNDPAGILPSASQLCHLLPLLSAYSHIGEPRYTNYTGHFVGTLDYIFYSKSHLNSASCLEIDAEHLVKQHTALPSPHYSSDHLPLITEIEWLDN